MNRKERGQTEKLVARLVADELIELDGDAGPVVAEIGKLLVGWTGEGYRGEDLGEALAVMPGVGEVFASDDELQDAIEGWRRAVRGPVLTDLRNPEIEARLAAEDDDELAAVYADWLIEHGNPLGELLACATDDKLRKRVLAKHGEALWGPVAEYVRLYDFGWGRAGVVSIAVTRATSYELEWGRVIGAILDRPLAAFCRRLSIGPLPSSATTQVEEMLEVIAARPRPTLRQIALNGGVGNVAAAELAAGYPNLTSLELHVSNVQNPLEHPSLERLALRVDSFTAIGNALVRASLPRLRSLTLGTRYREPLDQLGRLFRGTWFDQLEALDVRGLGPRDEVLARYGDRLAHLRLI